MKTGRLEAFSDGVLAIIITIMVLELKVPEGTDISNLMPLLPKFLSYILSFVYVGIYWNNHHHLFHIIERVNGNILWANLALLFSLSLLPFTSAWMGENHFASSPTILYGVNLLLCASTFTILEIIAIKSNGSQSKLARALKNKMKENASVILYSVGILLGYFYPIASMLCYSIVALIWIIPDTRIEKFLNSTE